MTVKFGMEMFGVSFKIGNLLKNKFLCCQSFNLQTVRLDKVSKTKQNIFTFKKRQSRYLIKQKCFYVFFFSDCKTNAEEIDIVDIPYSRHFKVANTFCRN